MTGISTRIRQSIRALVCTKAVRFAKAWNRRFQPDGPNMAELSSLNPNFPLLVPLPFIYSFIYFSICLRVKTF